MLLFCVLLAAPPAWGQLSQNSGINANDTYAAFDLTLSGQATANLPQAIYNPSTGATSSAVTLSLPGRNWHVEVGYDSNDQIVLNLYSSDPIGDVTQFPNIGVSTVQLRNGNLTVFDETGAPIPISLPNNAPLPLPLSLLGPIPGSSVLSYLLISDPNATASAMNGTVQYSGSNTTYSNNIGSYAYPSGSHVQMAYITASLSNGQTGTATLAYQQYPEGWALTQITQNSSFDIMQTNQATQFANFQWFDNPAGDSRRAAKAVAPPAPPPLATPSVSPAPLPGASSGSGTIKVENVGTGQTNLLYQHGIFSDGSTWSRMDGWIQQDFPLHTVAISSLNSTDYLSNQATNLISLLEGTGQSSYIGIGHSNGGPVTRDAAYRGRLGLINRVITLDATNGGAQMTEVSRIALAGAVTALAKSLVSWGTGTPLGGAVFTLGNLAIVGAPNLALIAFDTAIPATTDMQPGSVFLTALNSRNEAAAFQPRVGIQGASRWRWVEFRELGDKACYPETWCGGRAVSNYANGVYAGLLTCALLAELYGDFGLAWDCLYTAVIMDYIDLFWYTYTSFGDTSDGIVNDGAQYYANATVNHVVHDSDSHAGNKNSDKDRAMLDYALQFDLGLIPTWCQTGSLSPVSAPVTDLGAVGQSFNFSLTTGKPCPWTAVSNVPWISVTSGQSGSSSASVSYSVDINLSPVSRTGMITITGLGSSVVFTVTQAGIPAGAAIGGVTISGSEQTETVDNPNYPCVYSPGRGAGHFLEDAEPLLNCPPTFTYWDHGSLSVTANGHTDSVSFGQTSTASSIAYALAAAINADANSYVQAGVMGTTVWLVSKATQGADYAFSSAYTFDSAHFSDPSFTTGDSGATLSGSP